jgi:hypothetical protein
MKIIYLTSSQGQLTTGRLNFKCNYSTADKFITLNGDGLHLTAHKLYEIEFNIDSYDISKKKPAYLEFSWKNNEAEAIDAPKILEFSGKPSYYKLRNMTHKTFLIPTEDICINLYLVTLNNAKLNKMTCFIKVFNVDC